MWRTVMPWALVVGVVGCAAEADAGAESASRQRLVTDASEAAVDGTAPASLSPELERLRVATERFRDVEVALSEGYVRDPMDLCVTSSFEGYPRQLGTMGLHYFRPDLLGLTAETPRVDGTGTHQDFENPAVLVYIPRPDGTLQLGAVENLVWAKAWHDAGNRGRPEFMGQEYWRMVDNPATTDVDEAHGFEPHYELHVWLHLDNPAGVFAPFNPAATCEHHRPMSG